MKLYGEERSDGEIAEFVQSQAKAIGRNRNHRFHSLMAVMPEGRLRALDYGCGWGINAVGMWERGHDVLGIDYAANEVEISKHVWGERERLHFAEASIGDSESASFDVVLSSQVAEHVHNLGNYLCGINRVLRREGALVISVPGGITPRSVRSILRRDLEASLRRHSADRLANYDKTHDHIHAWDQFHFVRLLASVGFEMERYVPAEGVPWKKKYLSVGRSRVRNLCYTMVFRFRKTRDVQLPREA